MTQPPVAPVAGEEDEQIKSGQVGNGRIAEPAVRCWDVLEEEIRTLYRADAALGLKWDTAPWGPNSLEVNTYFPGGPVLPR